LAVTGDPPEANRRSTGHFGSLDPAANYAAFTRNLPEGPSVSNAGVSGLRRPSWVRGVFGAFEGLLESVGAFGVFEGPRNLESLRMARPLSPGNSKVPPSATGFFGFFGSLGDARSEASGELDKIGRIREAA
jgi:hypothetical protein